MRRNVTSTQGLTAVRLEQWVVANLDRLKWFGKRYKLSPGRLDELVQELCLRVLVNPPEDEVAGNEARVTEWLMGVFRHLVIDTVRQEKRLERLYMAARLNSAQADLNEPISGCIREELVAKVWKVLDLLVERESAANVHLIVERCLNSRPLNEVASESNLTPAEASARLQRTKRKFRQLWLLVSRGGGASRSRVIETRIRRQILGRRTTSIVGEATCITRYTGDCHDTATCWGLLVLCSGAIRNGSRPDRVRTESTGCKSRWSSLNA